MNILCLTLDGYINIIDINNKHSLYYRELKEAEVLFGIYNFLNSKGMFYQFNTERKIRYIHKNTMGYNFSWYYYKINYKLTESIKCMLDSEDLEIIKLGLELLI